MGQARSLRCATILSPFPPRTNPTSARVLRAKTTPGLAGTTARLLSVKRSLTQGWL